MHLIPVPIRPLLSAALCSLGLLLYATAAPAQSADHSTHADAVTDPYTASVPVAAQDPALRDAALREALVIVLMRVSGNTGGSVIETISAAAPQLVQRYGYQRDAQGALSLLAGFDRKAVDMRLRAAGLPVWGAYAGSAERFELTITGLRNSAQYLNTLQRVEQIGGVRAVTVIKAQGDTLQLSVEAEGGREHFRAELASAGGWLPIIAQSGDGLAYRLP
jgi:hypothetical protein